MTEAIEATEATENVRTDEKKLGEKIIKNSITKKDIRRKGKLPGHRTFGCYK